MAKLQAYFEEFNDEIKLGEFDDNAMLREKRDILRAKLDERLPEVFRAHGEECPKYYFRDQGSYKLRTGIKPRDGDFDIDQGLYFLVDPTQWEGVVLKERVFDALNGHTKKVELRRSCVTVFYQRGGEDVYHVDFAVYSDWNGVVKLAKGKANSGADHRFWEDANPELLKDTILGAWEGEDRKQFRRTIRYLKEWKNVRFDSGGNGAPLGIGLTGAAYDEFQTCFVDVVAGERDDAAALLDVVQAMVRRFSDKVTESGAVERRLEVRLPVVPGNDLFERMTGKQMDSFESKLEALAAALENAIEDVDPRSACQTLQDVLGDRFPVPASAATAAVVPRAVVGNNQSA